MQAGVEPCLAESGAVEKRRIDSQPFAETGVGLVEHISTIVEGLLHGHKEAFVAIFVAHGDAVGFLFPLESHDLDGDFVTVGQQFGHFVVLAVIGEQMEVLCKGDIVDGIPFLGEQKFQILESRVFHPTWNFGDSHFRIQILVMGDADLLLRHRAAGGAHPDEATLRTATVFLDIIKSLPFFDLDFYDMLLPDKLCAEFNKRARVGKNLVFNNVGDFLKGFVQILHATNTTIVIHSNINRSAIAVQKGHDFLGNGIGVFLLQFSLFGFRVCCHSFISYL